MLRKLLGWYKNYFQTKFIKIIGQNFFFLFSIRFTDCNLEERFFFTVLWNINLYIVIIKLQSSISLHRRYIFLCHADCSSLIILISFFYCLQCRGFHCKSIFHVDQIFCSLLYHHLHIILCHIMNAGAKAFSLLILLFHFLPCPKTKPCLRLIHTTDYL